MGANGGPGATESSGVRETRRGVRPLAVRPEQAAEALGVSRSFFFSAILPELRVVRCGRLRLVPVTELERWLEANATRVFGR